MVLNFFDGFSVNDVLLGLGLLKAEFLLFGVLVGFFGTISWHACHAAEVSGLALNSGSWLLGLGINNFGAVGSIGDLSLNNGNEGKNSEFHVFGCKIIYIKL